MTTISSLLTRTTSAAGSSPKRTATPGIKPEPVTVTIVAHTDGTVRHLVDADTVISYGAPVVGGGEVSEWAAGAPEPGLELTGGYIALQSESHPIQFRRVAWRPLRRP